MGRLILFQAIQPAVNMLIVIMPVFLVHRPHTAHIPMNTLLLVAEIRSILLVIRSVNPRVLRINSPLNIWPLCPSLLLDILLRPRHLLAGHISLPADTQLLRLSLLLDSLLQHTINSPDLRPPYIKLLVIITIMNIDAQVVMSHLLLSHLNIILAGHIKRLLAHPLVHMSLHITSRPVLIRHHLVRRRMARRTIGHL